MKKRITNVLTILALCWIGWAATEFSNHYLEWRTHNLDELVCVNPEPTSIPDFSFCDEFEPKPTGFFDYAKPYLIRNMIISVLFPFIGVGCINLLMLGNFKVWHFNKH